MISEIQGALRCVDVNPVLAGTSSGWWGEFEYLGTEPRILYGALANYGSRTNEIIWLEIVCGGTGHPPGTIINKYWIPDGETMPEAWDGAVEFLTGLIACMPLPDAEGNPRFRAREYRYGVWARCDDEDELNGIAEVQVFWLKNAEMAAGLDWQTVDPNCSAGCDNPPSPREVATADAIWGNAGFEDQSPCCANSHIYQATNGPAMECQQVLDIPILGLPGGLEDGLVTCPTCFNATHPFVGCECFMIGDQIPGIPGYIEADGWQCGTYITPCQIIKWFIQLEWPPAEGSGPPIL